MIFYKGPLVRDSKRAPKARRLKAQGGQRFQKNSRAARATSGPGSPPPGHQLRQGPLTAVPCERCTRTRRPDSPPGADAGTLQCA